MRRGNALQGGENIPVKNGKATTVILTEEEELAIREITAKRLIETGDTSKSRTVRYLIREGIKAVKAKEK